MQEKILETIFMELSKPNAVPQMLITAHGINRLQYINDIKHSAKGYYNDIYHLALPIDDMSHEEYFEEIAEVFRCRVSKPHHIKKDIIHLVNSSREDTFVLVTDFENDLHLDDFAKFMRAILDQVNGRLKLITIGGEKLANLKTNMGINSYFNYFNQIIIDKPSDYKLENIQNTNSNDIDVAGNNSGTINQGNNNTINNTHHHYYNEEKS